jgi:hypothetical protein
MKEEENVFLNPARQGKQALTPLCIKNLNYTKRSVLRFIMYGMSSSCEKNLRGRGTT